MFVELYAKSRAAAWATRNRLAAAGKGEAGDAGPLFVLFMVGVAVLAALAIVGAVLWARSAAGDALKGGACLSSPDGCDKGIPAG